MGRLFFNFNYILIEIMNRTKNVKKTTPKLTSNSFAYGMKGLSWLSQEPKLQLHHLAGINRPVTEKHTNAIGESVDKYDCLRPVIIAYLSFLEVKGYYIVEGQHLYNYLLKEGLVIRVKIDSFLELIDCLARVNNVGKPWILKDYITSWTNIKPDYTLLLEKQKEFKFDMLTTTAILSNQITNGNGGNTNLAGKIKTGNFKVVDVERAYNELQQLSFLLSLFNKNVKLNKRFFLSEIIKFYRLNPSHNKEFVRDYVTVNKTFIIKKVNTTQSFLEHLQTTYLEVCN